MFGGLAGQTNPRRMGEGVFAAPDYKELYLELFRANEQARRLLEDAQRRAEQEFLRADPPPIRLDDAKRD